ncbi:MAG TPA: acyltransferase family protein [Nocardioides sp.]|nr:acyltransferase family protein [Nocardioides sp.]
MSHVHAGRAMRTDIQGLRAVAVGMVVIYHLYPSAIPGGYVGVDIFFVISGFLITSHLLTHVPGGLPDLMSFWGRRIRRLLPAALTVILVSLIAVHMILPSTQWDDNAHDARAAALYYVNWELASRSVSYLAQGQNPSAFQHFWSLSVEEQFYFVWPIAIALLALIATRLRVSRTRVLAVGLCALVVVSFGYSVLHTASNPQPSYFISTTRFWELGVGGLLALVVRRLPGQRPPFTVPARALITWTGLAMIAASGAFYSDLTAFPGSAAALPVVGAALLLLGAGTEEDRLTPGPLLARGPVQWLGDVSYSVYLWHWPLRVLVPFLFGGQVADQGLSLLQAAVVAVATLVLAALTEKYVEQPFRNPALAHRLRGTLAVAAAAMAVVVGVATSQLVAIGHAEARGRHDVKVALQAGGPCLGAAALDPGADCPPVAFKSVIPIPLLAARDWSPAYVEVGGKACRALPNEFWMRTCVFGRPHGRVRIGLLGNSHADQWLPALQAIAKTDDLRIDTRVASRCAASDTHQVMITAHASDRCQTWARGAARALVRSHPDLVVMSDRISGQSETTDIPAPIVAAYAEGYRRILQILIQGGLRVLVIRDTPAPGFLVPDCLAEHEDRTNRCDGTRDAWLPPDPTPDVVRQLDNPLVTTIDMTDHICGPTVCTAITGGVITYADATHLSATYSHTLGPYLGAAIEKALGRHPS